MKWMHEENGALPINSWCAEVEEGAMIQAKNLARHPAVAHHVALMPDCHPGYGMPIGGVIAAKDAVIPSAVGVDIDPMFPLAKGGAAAIPEAYGTGKTVTQQSLAKKTDTDDGVDIGCGMVAVETDVSAERLAEMQFRRNIQQRVKELIPVGEGEYHKEKQEWDGFEEYLDNGGDDRFATTLDRRNLGTLGGGNHFIEIQSSDEGKVWMMIHSGSRNLGKRVEEHYHTRAASLDAMFRSPLPDPDLAFLPVATNDGHNYLRDMNFSLRYARENRRRMMASLKKVFSEFVPEAQFLREIDVHHNYATFESHFGETFCIHRKGAISAKPGEIGIVPGSMGTASYIVRGLGNPLSFMSSSHGAGRRMSRFAACENLTVAECDAAMAGIVCERWHRLRGGGKRRDLLDLSEAPQAYKSIDEVIAAEGDLVEPLVRLVPIAVLKG
ncbi:MAG: RtcB family protein [Victivallaceae bacterium]|nr:RtcB family protein [Victivallaceae bacterium]